MSRSCQRIGLNCLCHQALCGCTCLFCDFTAREHTSDLFKAGFTGQNIHLRHSGFTVINTLGDMPMLMTRRSNLRAVRDRKNLTIIRQTAEEFIEGCKAHSGLNHEQAVELWNRVGSFTGFSFCKSHSATYAQLSFQCTYLKAHYPAQFLAAVISNRHGFYRRDVYLNEARRWGVRILPMDVNESGIKYRGCGSWMRPGFMHVRNIRGQSLEAMVETRRREGPFRDLVELA